MPKVLVVIMAPVVVAVRSIGSGNDKKRSCCFF